MAASRTARTEGGRAQEVVIVLGEGPLAVPADAFVQAPAHDLAGIGDRILDEARGVDRLVIEAAIEPALVAQHPLGDGRHAEEGRPRAREVNLRLCMHELDKRFDAFRAAAIVPIHADE